MRYRLPGLPQGQQVSAFMPGLARAAGSGYVSYKRSLVGQPGTQGIPVEPPQVMQSDLGIREMGTSRSSDAPGVIYPQLYYQSALTERPGAGMPIRVWSDNLMPVPAVDPRGTGAVLAKPVLQRGQAQIAQPRAVPRWASG